MLRQPMNSAARFVYGPLYWEPVVLSVGSGPYTYRLMRRVSINEYVTNDYTGYRIDPTCGRLYAIYMDESMAGFDDLDEAKHFVEVTYELTYHG